MIDCKDGIWCGTQEPCTTYIVSNKRWTLAAFEGNHTIIKQPCLVPDYSCRRLSFFLFFFLHWLSSPFFFSLPPIRNSDPGSHSRLISPPPTTVRALHFYRQMISALSSVVDSRRIVFTLPTLGALSSSSFCCIFANQFEMSPRQDSNSRANTYYW